MKVSKQVIRICMEQACDFHLMCYFHKSILLQNDCFYCLLFVSMDALMNWFQDFHVYVVQLHSIWGIKTFPFCLFQVLVVANPANTNALILKEYAPSIPEKNISCLTRLDHNRALGQISERLNVQVSDVKNVIIWGNHSSSQYPDVNHATVATPAGEKPVRELVADDAWYNESVTCCFPACVLTDNCIPFI